MLVALVDACGIFERILTKSELAERRERIALVGGLDLIGLSVHNAIRSIRKPVVEEESLRRSFLDRAGPTGAKRPPMAPRALPLLGHALRLRPVPTRPPRRVLPIPGPGLQGPRPDGRAHGSGGGRRRTASARSTGRSLFRSHGTYTPPVREHGCPTHHPEHGRRSAFQAPQGDLSPVSPAIASWPGCPRSGTFVLNELPENGGVVAIEAFSRLTAKSIGLACTGYLMSDREVGDMDFFLRRMIASRVLRSLPRFMARTGRAKRAKAGFFDVFSGMLRDPAGRRRRRRPGGRGGRDARAAQVQSPVPSRTRAAGVLPGADLLRAAHHRQHRNLRHVPFAQASRGAGEGSRGGGTRSTRTGDPPRRGWTLSTSPGERCWRPCGCTIPSIPSSGTRSTPSTSAGTPYRRGRGSSFRSQCPTIATSSSRIRPASTSTATFRSAPNTARPASTCRSDSVPTAALGNAIADAHLTFALVTILHHLDVEMDPPRLRDEDGLSRSPGGDEEVQAEVRAQGRLTGGRIQPAGTRGQLGQPGPALDAAPVITTIYVR